MRERLVEDAYTCASCGFCRFGCPVYKEIGFESATARGKMYLLKRVLEGELGYTERVVDSFYMCAQCQNCKQLCPTGIDFGEDIAILKEMFIREGKLPFYLFPLRDNVIEKGNPFGRDVEERGEWLPGKYRTPKSSEYLYFAGCSASYASTRIAKSIVKILDQIEFDFTVLGKEESCCGSPLERMGETVRARELMEKNVQRFRELGVKTVIVSCAGCLKTLTHSYPKDFKVLHVTQLFDQLMREGRLGFEKELDKKVVYFDGCDIGRHCGIYEEPRNILRSIPGVKLIDYEYSREEALCCGGPLVSSHPELAHKIASSRAKEAKELGAEIIATACPTCMVNLKEGAKLAQIEMEIQDIPMLLPKFLKRG
ncbi:MAG: (Fe-S)-binding protein [Actinomycetota bacterium]|nr:(Fe-S)-binding protein [Actinomycetota bacterium]